VCLLLGRLAASRPSGGGARPRRAYGWRSPVRHQERGTRRMPCASRRDRRALRSPGRRPGRRPLPPGSALAEALACARSRPIATSPGHAVCHAGPGEQARAATDHGYLRCMCHDMTFWLPQPRRRSRRCADPSGSPEKSSPMDGIIHTTQRSELLAMRVRALCAMAFKELSTRRLLLSSRYACDNAA